MKQQLFQQQFEAQWLVFEQQLSLLESRQLGLRLNNEAALDNFIANYRRLCHQLALARSRHYSPQLIEKLNQLALRGHQQLYQRKGNLWQQCLSFVVMDFPRLVRQEWRLCLLAFLLLYIPAILFTVLVYWRPELVYTVLDASMLQEMEYMYDPSASHARAAESDFAMFGFYIQNNISIGFQTFATGLLLGLGSLFYLTFNGAFFGAIAGHLINQDSYIPFFSFVITHGSFELTAIVFAGAAGLKLGYALIAPGQFSRLDALKHHAQISIKLMYGVILMLTIAAFIEAFWSSSTLVQPWGKFLVGSCCWLFVLSYFWRAGRKQHVA